MKCDYCNKEFTPKVNRQRFCCKRCSDYYHQLKKVGKERNMVRPINSKDNCKVCNSEYTVKTGAQKYCSEKCKRIVTRRNYKLKHPEKVRAYKVRFGKYKRTHKSCIICGFNEVVHYHHIKGTQINEVVCLCPNHHALVHLGKIKLPIETSKY